MTFSLALPREVESFTSTLVERDQKTGTIITVFKRNTGLGHILLRSFF
jgi:hypothetical protein